MKSRGTVLISRELIDHPILQGGPFDRRSAWLSLLTEASWSDREVVVNGHKIALGCGELVSSSRFLAQRWDWSEPKVRRFLATLAAEQMIQCRVHRTGPSDRGQTVISIVNFAAWQRLENRRRTDAPSDAPPDAATDAPSAAKVADKTDLFQHSSSPSDAPSDAPPDAPPVSKPTQNIITIEERKKIICFPRSKNGELPKRVDSPQATEWPSDAFERWYAAYPRKKQPHDARKAFAKMRTRGDIGFEQLIERTAAFAKSVTTWDKDRRQFIKYPASWLNSGSYLDEPDTENPAASTLSAPTRDPRTFSDVEWRDRLAGGAWSSFWGPRPGEPGCLVPARLLMNGGAHG